MYFFHHLIGHSYLSQPLSARKRARMSQSDLRAFTDPKSFASIVSRRDDITLSSSNNVRKRSFQKFKHRKFPNDLVSESKLFCHESPTPRVFKPQNLTPSAHTILFRQRFDGHIRKESTEAPSCQFGTISGGWQLFPGALKMDLKNNGSLVNSRASEPGEHFTRFPTH